MRASAIFAALAVLATSSAAYAFCRTTTCGPSTCKPSADCDFCLQGGYPLYWPGGCTSFSIQANGSLVRHITAATTQEIVTTALGKWISADCGGDTFPAIHLFTTKPIEVACNIQQYNQDSPNANIWMYRDDYWPYTGATQTLALTTVTFNVETGEIFDADVEINSVDNPLTVGDENIQGDLESIITHESGHFLGLSHTCVKDATMYANYTFGTTDLRTLETDDIQGICTIYPPGSDSPYCDPTPRHGFGTDCGEDPIPKKGCCTTAPGGSSHQAWPASLFALLLTGSLAWRRRRHLQK